MYQNKKKKEPWRIVVFSIAVAFIVFMWVKKDIVDIYTTMPSEQIMPLIVTTLAVSLLKVVVIAGVILLLKWLFSKMKRR